MPLTTGLAIAAAGCAALGAVSLVVLFLAARRPGLRGRPAAVAYRLLAAAVVAGAAGVSLAALTARSGSATLAAGGPAANALRYRIAGQVHLGYAGSTLFMLAGLLLLPGAVRADRARLRHVVDGLLLAASGFFVAWTLVIEPLHEQALGGPVARTMSHGCLAVAGPTLLAIGALGVLVVTAARARPRGPLLICCAGAALAGVSGPALAGGIAFGGGAAVLGAAAGYGVGLAVLAAAARCAEKSAAAPAGLSIERPGISLIPVAMAIVACLIRLSTGRSLDDVGLFTAAVIAAALAAQQALARRDLHRYAEHKAQSEAHFRAMAHTDALTGLANRRQLLKTLQEEAVGGPPCVLLAIDLDGFKNINDTRGHDVGDAVLVEVANRLRGNLRPGDLAARLGGDEFAVLMWARPAEALIVSERLLGVLGRPYELATGTVFVSASIGMAGCATADDIQTLLRNADLALRFAKQRGKRRVEKYDAAYDQWVRRRTELEHEMRGAVERGELMVVYQPVVSLPTGDDPRPRVAGVEALLRWFHPRLGSVAPDEFIPLAEESGLIDGLGTFVLHEACHQLSRWLADGHDVWLAVNVSVRELHTPEYVARVTETLRRHRVPAQRLVVEVTEHAVALDLEQVVDRLTALRAAGVRVALDDFGSGYSSLGQLRTLPVDTLKIDRSILGPPDNPCAHFAAPLVDVVVRLGNRLGLEVVAEGISDLNQARLIRQAGCSHAQGALFGGAMPAERVEAMFGVPVDLPGLHLPADDRPEAAQALAGRPEAAQALAGGPDAQHVGSVDSSHEMRQS